MVAMIFFFFFFFSRNLQYLIFKKIEFGRFNQIICSNNYLLLEALLFIYKNYMVLHTAKKIILIFFIFRNY